MAGQGAGPSRRSHTKSRKGCKTCKRRHIRCDETFPQCRNCTKHQVRCDYMENIGSDSEGQSSPEQASVLLTPGSEDRVELWQQSGTFPFPDLQVFPPPPTNEYSKNDLRLIHHLSYISNDLLIKGSTGLTMWSQKMPKFLSIASSYPFVMHAALSFSANHLAWLHGSSETRNLHIQHGTIALRGLHEAISSFSHANADAALAGSLLMLWQATDWRSWSSLRTGIQTILGSMQSWKYESLFAEFITDEDLVATSFRTHRRKPSVNPTERAALLHQTVQALQRAQMALMNNEVELHWLNQLITYVQRLQSLNPASTPEEQFSQMYYLRKWLFWVPVSLLQRNDSQGATMVTLAYFYSTALALEPLFPDLGSSFCGALALPPLEAIINLTNAMQSDQAMVQSLSGLVSLMNFPQQTALNYRSRTLQAQQLALHQEPSMVSFSEMLNYANMGNLSPAFVPSPLYHGTPQSSSSQSPFLEIPTPHSGFRYGTQSWGVPSPAFPAQAYASQEDQMYGYVPSMPIGGFRGGFVPPAPVWT